MSTQALYTHFGGMPGLFDALAEDGFVRFAQHVDAVAETDDPVADFFTQGHVLLRVGARTSTALPPRCSASPAAALRRQTGFELTRTGTRRPFRKAGRRSEVLVQALDRVRVDGGTDPARSRPLLVAGQFLSATHGYVLLEIAGVLRPRRPAASRSCAQLVINLMVGLGDSREAAERSLLAASRARSL